MPSGTIYALLRRYVLGPVDRAPRGPRHLSRDQAAADLRADVALEQFPFAGITFVNYRGTDDSSTVSVGATKAKFSPPASAVSRSSSTSSPRARRSRTSTRSAATSSRIVRDLQRDEWVDLEMTTYPLFVCSDARRALSRPVTLIRRGGLRPAPLPECGSSRACGTARRPSLSEGPSLRRLRTSPPSRADVIVIDSYTTWSPLGAVPVLRRCPLVHGKSWQARTVPGEIVTCALGTVGQRGPAASPDGHEEGISLRA